MTPSEKAACSEQMKGKLIITRRQGTNLLNSRICELKIRIKVEFSESECKSQYMSRISFFPFIYKVILY